MKLKESLITRRQLIHGWLAGAGSFFTVSLLYPLYRFLTPRDLGAGPSEIVLPAADAELSPNTGKIFAFGPRPALLLKTPQGELVALTAVCSHFECTVHYDPQLGRIVCPCHKGYYDVYGKNIEGPPPRPLERYEITPQADGFLIARPGVKKNKGTA